MSQAFCKSAVVVFFHLCSVFVYVYNFVNYFSGNQMGLKQRYLYQNFESTTLLHKEINVIICNQGYNIPVIPQLTNVV